MQSSPRGGGCAPSLFPRDDHCHPSEGYWPVRCGHDARPRRRNVKTNIASIDRALAAARVDWLPSRRQPRLEWVVVATVLAIAGALIADALLVKLGTSIFPSTSTYPHFQFDDYAKLTVIGVVVGCAGWPIVTRLSSTPRWLFSRLAVLISLVLFLPDVWLLLKHQPPRAVLVLMTMHVAVALITYQVVVRVAPPRDPREGQRRHLRKSRQEDVAGARGATLPPLESSGHARSAHRVRTRFLRCVATRPDVAVPDPVHAAQRLEGGTGDRRGYRMHRRPLRGRRRGRCHSPAQHPTRASRTRPCRRRGAHLPRCSHALQRGARPRRQ